MLYFLIGFTVQQYSFSHREVYMGIIANLLSILAGGALVSIFKSRLVMKDNRIFSICIMLISSVGVIESLFRASPDGKIAASSLYPVVIIFALGAIIGGALRIDERLSSLSQSNKPWLNGFIDATVFFGIGGLQICGSILLGVEGDSSQLFLKSIVDFPFAIMFGAIYGKSVLLAAIPIAAIQGLIALPAFFLGDFVSEDTVSQLSCIGYLILFFSGYNMMSREQNKIKNTNMLPSILLVIAYNALRAFIPALP